MSNIFTGALSGSVRAASKTALMCTAAVLYASAAQASLVTSIPGGTTLTPPNNGSVPASFFSNTGNIQLGTGIGRDIVWSSNSGSAVGGYSSGYGLCGNGSWSGTPAYFGTNSGSNSTTMTFTFNDGNASSVGGFMNWGCTTDFTIQAFDASNTLLETYTLNFSATGVNNGLFYAIQRPTADIKYFVMFGGFAVLRDFTFLAAVPCPVGAGNDTCVIDSTTNQATAIDADGGTDTLQLGGASNFSFNVAGIGTTYTNFETFQKIGASNVSLTGTAGTPVNWDVQAGTLTTTTGNNIGNTATVNVGAAGTFAVAASETIGKLTGTGATTMSAGQTLTLGDASNFSYNGTTSGAGGLTKIGSGKFSTANLGHTGLTTIAAGELNANGAIAGSVQINAGATLSGTNTIAGNLSNFGLLKPGNSPGTTIVAGNYVGGGVMNVEVQFSNAGTPVNGVTHDFLNIGGNASGTTLINIVPFAPSGSPAATTGNGIELVRVGGTTGAAQFALSAPVFLGAYEYTLNYLPNYSASLDGYFLQSRIGEGLFGDAAMFASSQALVGDCFRGADELVGDGTRSTMGRGWAKFSAGNRSTGADTGIETDQDYTCGSGGVDVRVADNLRMGVSGGYTDTNVDVQTLAGVADLAGDGGMIQATVGFAHENIFANLAIGYSNINWNYDGPSTALRSATTKGMIGSLQAGMLFPMGDWRFGMMAELGYDDFSCSDQCLVPGTAADMSNWTAKGSLRLDGTMHDGKLMPFLAVSLSDSLDGENTISNGTAVIVTETASSVLGAKAGLTAMVAPNTAVFINGGITEGLSNDVSGTEGTIGAKLFW